MTFTRQKKRAHDSSRSIVDGNEVNKTKCLDKVDALNPKESEHVGEIDGSG